MKLILSLFVITSIMAAQPSKVEYTLGMPDPKSHVFEVSATFTNLASADGTLDLIMPVWRSGRYVLFDLAGNVITFQARDANGKELAWEKIDKMTWRVQKKGATNVTASYTLFANDFTTRKNGLNAEHAFVNGAAVFMYAEKYRRLPVRLSIKPYGDWHVTSGLEHTSGSPNMLVADTYDHLVDCPIEIGNQKEYEFDVDGVPHVISITGEGNYQPDTLKRDMGKIVKAAKDFWGEFPYKRYVFFVHLAAQGGGGTEYLNSTIMGARALAFRNPGAYRGFLGLTSHEFFHTWNVKQLRPKGMHPYDYTKENYAKEYWIAEGTTSYYSPLISRRAGFGTARQYVEGLGAQILEDRSRPGNKVQSLSESSFDAWIKYWKPSEHSYNTQSDYYGKGSHVSLLLDLEIRHRSRGKSSLDDVMRAMYKRFPITGKGYTIDDFQRVSEEFAGGSLKDFFNGYVHGTVPLDWEKALGYAGLEVQARDSARKVSLGASISDRGGMAQVTRVVAGSPAAEAGLDVGDEVVAFNGYRMRASDINERVGEMKPGETVTLTVFRSDRLREIEISLRLQDVPPYRVTKTKEPTDLQKKIYDAWLQDKWE
ncbi:MAG: PDZ domain-containing protein [Bacteroidota bacterium]